MLYLIFLLTPKKVKKKSVCLYLFRKDQIMISLKHYLYSLPNTYICNLGLKLLQLFWIHRVLLKI